MQVAVALILVRTVAALVFSVEPLMLQALVAPLCKLPDPAGVVSCEIAASHTVFNLIITVVVVPFSDSYAKLVKRLVVKLGYERPVFEEDALGMSLPSGSEVMEILVGDDNESEDSHDAKRKE